MAKTSADVVIVGGGIAGSALACALGGAPLRVVLIESAGLMPAQPQAGAGVAGYDVRVSALGHAARQQLSRLGAWSRMAEVRVNPYTRMRVWDAQGTGAIEFDAAQLREPCLGHIVENRVCIWALQQALADFSNIRVLGARRVVDLQAVDGADARAGEAAYALVLDDGSELAPGLVVAADGALSTIRSFAGFATRDWDYQHVATVATVQTEQPNQHTAWQRFLPEGPLAFLPLSQGGDEHLSSIVWSAVPALATSLAEMSDASFCRALGDAFEQRLGAVVAAGPRQQFPLRQRHATSYYKPGLVLVGDAAHTIHPLAGQGINLGLKDVDVLAQELQRAAALGVAPGAPEILARYQRRRLADNLGMMAAMEGFKRLFAEQDLAVRWLRNAGMSRLDRMPGLKQRIMRQAMGL
jgi:2-octaprenylphenol hydroxylase